ncbi:MAG: DUF4173 domain-containing protein [Planctomycetaceae bacterium]|nr:DUF4173 domain-containing protein [Planctomycetaceae bacterium]
MDLFPPHLEATPTPIEEFVDERRPVRWREVVAVLLLVVVCDLAMYRGRGFTGYALLFALAPACLAFGSDLHRGRRQGWLFVAVLFALAFRLAWCGSWLAVGCGYFCLIALTMCLAGQMPQILSMLAFTGQSLAAGAIGLNQYGETARRNLQPLKSSTWIAVIMPLGALGLFGTIFILANPDLVSFVSKEWQLWLDRVSEWLIHFSILEIPFWIVTAWITVGLLRPLEWRGGDSPSKTVDPTSFAPQSAALFPAFRNTLLAVIVLCVVYLAFEFQTLWFRTFPKGFHYSGYAHEGAAWLTIALALATMTLSLIFRGQMLQDPRLAALKRLAWVWSALNLFLAVAVYNRLWIYVGFNGLTWMRMVGFFGTSAVVIGFLLAVYKIAQHRNFVWLIRADLWALVATIIAFALTPVDLIVMRYNTQRIMAGDSAPSVQISVHPIDAEGILQLLPLVDCPDEIVRNGVRAYFAQHWIRLEALGVNRPVSIARWDDFSRLQISERLLANELTAHREAWEPFHADSVKRNAAWSRFKEYAYQWY